MWGCVVAAGMVVLVAGLTPEREAPGTAAAPQAGTAEVPPGTGFTEGLADREPVLPEGDTAPATADAPRLPQPMPEPRPDAATSDSPAAVPQIAGADTDLSEPPDAPQGPEAGAPSTPDVAPDAAPAPRRPERAERPASEAGAPPVSDGPAAPPVQAPRLQSAARAPTSPNASDEPAPTSPSGGDQPTDFAALTPPEAGRALDAPVTEDAPGAPDAGPAAAVPTAPRPGAIDASPGSVPNADAPADNLLSGTATPSAPQRQDTPGTPARPPSEGPAAPRAPEAPADVPADASPPAGGDDGPRAQSERTASAAATEALSAPLRPGRAGDEARLPDSATPSAPSAPTLAPDLPSDADAPDAEAEAGLASASPADEAARGPRVDFGGAGAGPEAPSGEVPPGVDGPPAPAAPGPELLAETQIPANPDSEGPAAPRAPAPETPLSDLPAGLAPTIEAGADAAPIRVGEAPEAPPLVPGVGGGGPALSAPDMAEFEAGATEAGPSGPQEGTVEAGDALDRYAAEFAAPGDQPLVAVLLLDEGGPLPDLDMPVTLVIDAQSADAAGRAAAFRAMGQEVMVTPAFPDSAGGAGAALAAARRAVPEAVAVFDPPTATAYPARRDMLEEMLDGIDVAGLGYVSGARGLDSALRLARGLGVPAATVYRDIDGEGQTQAAVKRFLDQAAFRARQEEALILIGRTRPETISGLQEWVDGSRAQRVTLSPVSAVLRALR